MKLKRHMKIFHSPICITNSVKLIDFQKCKNYTLMAIEIIDIAT